MQSMSDDEFIALAQHGSAHASEYLLAKYHTLVEQKARMYFLAGADQEDIVQEGMIGLFKAIRDYRADRQLPFRAFAELCISRQIFTAIKAATRQKHIPLNSYVSIHSTLFNPDSDRTLLDTLEEVHACNPEDIVIAQHFADEFRKIVKRDLSDLELAVMHCYIRGLSFAEIAQELNVHVKAIDNAVFRVKRKLKRSLKPIIDIELSIAAPSKPPLAGALSH